MQDNCPAYSVALEAAVALSPTDSLAAIYSSDGSELALDSADFYALCKDINADIGPVTPVCTPPAMPPTFQPIDFSPMAFAQPLQLQTAAQQANIIIQNSNLVQGRGKGTIHSTYLQGTRPTGKQHLVFHDQGIEVLPTKQHDTAADCWLADPSTIGTSAISNDQLQREYAPRAELTAARDCLKQSRELNDGLRRTVSQLTRDNTSYLTRAHAEIDRLHQELSSIRVFSPLRSPPWHR